MLAASMPERVESLAKAYLNEPIFIAIGDSGEGARGVKQTVEWLEEADKAARLLAVLALGEGPYLVFVDSKQTAEKILAETTEGVAVLHGSVEKDETDEIVQKYERGELTTLVVSDMVGDKVQEIKGAQHVIVFDIGDDIQKYTQRIGIAARAEGAKGRSTCLISESDHSIFFDLKNLLKDCGQQVPHALQQHEASKSRGAAAAYAAKVQESK
jgi:superfamily II DNA/RNA helicase